ncbi:MAG: DUF4446 family protein [Armatimonadota bacterium]
MPLGFDSLIPYMLVLNVALAALVVAMVLRLRVLARQVSASGGDPNVLARLSASEREIGAAARRLEDLSGRLDRLGEQTSHSLRRIGLVRYDAFKELGGLLSFSVALLDSRQDGIVLSVLNNREGARAYAKPVTGGRSTFTLSEEERRAISET